MSTPLLTPAGFVRLTADEQEQVREWVHAHGIDLSDVAGVYRDDDSKYLDTYVADPDGQLAIGEDGGAVHRRVDVTSPTSGFLTGGTS